MTYVLYHLPTSKKSGSHRPVSYSFKKLFCSPLITCMTCTCLNPLPV